MSELGVSDVYKVYQTCMLVMRAFVTFYLLMYELNFVFVIFANNKMRVL